jgi:hypothetical protein
MRARIRTGDRRRADLNEVPGVYAIRCSESNRVYIGCTSNISLRWSTHILKLRDRIHHNKELQALWDEYGPETFSVELLEEEPEDPLESEEYWIDCYRRLKRLMNTGRRTPSWTEKGREELRKQGRSRRALTMEQANEIRWLWQQQPRPTMKTLASVYGIDKANIQKLLKGDTYNDR